MRIPHAICLLATVGVSACSRTEPPAVLTVEDVAPPTADAGRFPRLGTLADGSAFVSWIEQAEDAPRATLRFARRQGDRWTEVRTVASGDDWFVNWADFPALASTDGRHFLAHYLRRSAAGTYDYHVEIVRSADGGATWSPPARLHDHDGAGEHGFASLVALGAAGYAAVWLDGRAAGAHDGGHGAGAMGLFTRAIALDGTLGPETCLDARVCDCCPTAAVRASDGALIVAYRDRSDEEVRDVSVLRVEDGRAPKPAWSSRDGWKIAGCPVNGPALAVGPEHIALAWFTLGSGNESRVLCAFSRDGGRTFDAPVEIAAGGTAGRVDAAFDAEGRLVVSWLAADGSAAEWRASRVDPGRGLVDHTVLAPASAGRDGGCARLARDGSDLLFAWTETAAPAPRVAVRRIR